MPGIVTLASPPAPQGGGIPAGVYVLTAETIYLPAGKEGPTGQEFRLTQIFAADGTWSSSSESLLNGDPFGSSGTSGTFEVSGTSVDMTLTCPTNDPLPALSHTLEGTVLHLFYHYPMENTVIEQVLEKL